MKVIVIHPDTGIACALSNALEALEDVHVQARAGDLSAAYHLAEHLQPDAALVSGAFCEVPELDVMRLLFRGLGMSAILLAQNDRGVEHLRGRAARLGWSLVTADASPARLHSAIQRAVSTRPVRTGLTAGSAAGTFDPDRLVLIGSSTGGIDALSKVLGSFPAECPPTVIVQHTGAGFSEGLARLLDRQTAPTVVEARHREAIRPGHVFIAPGNTHHLTISPRDRRLVFRASSPSGGHRPSVDQLFYSALPIASSVTAAILTGMGRDGAHGLAALRAAGATTIAQDRGTSVVYGMPRVAKELGGVELELPLPKIGAAILSSCRRRAA